MNLKLSPEIREIIMILEQRGHEKQDVIIGGIVALSKMMSGPQDKLLKEVKDNRIKKAQEAPKAPEPIADQPTPQQP